MHRPFGVILRLGELFLQADLHLLRVWWSLEEIQAEYGICCGQLELLHDPDEKFGSVDVIVYALSQNHVVMASFWQQSDRDQNYHSVPNWISHQCQGRKHFDDSASREKKISILKIIPELVKLLRLQQCLIDGMWLHLAVSSKWNLKIQHKVTSCIQQKYEVELITLSQPRTAFSVSLSRAAWHC